MRADPGLNSIQSLNRKPGDGSGALHNRKFLVLSWGSVAVELPTIDSRLLFASLDLENVARLYRRALVNWCKRQSFMTPTGV